MQNEKIKEYREAIDAVQNASLIPRKDKKIPENYIVPTHGPAFVKALKENPELLNLISIYRINCSHLEKEPDLEVFAEFLRTIHPFVKILIDLQGPKPRIHELDATLGNRISIKVGDRIEVRYEPENSPERFCTASHFAVCFPEIVSVMQVGDDVIFDDGKMTATVREKNGDTAIIECREFTTEGPTFSLRGRSGICARNRPLGIPCVTDHDRKSIKFSRDILGFQYVDNIMVSYFSTPLDIEHFTKTLRDEYQYTGELGAKFETPQALLHADEVLAPGEMKLTMFGRGDLRVEMDPRARKNMHDVQTYFFTTCRKYNIESICATGFLESMLTPLGQPTPEEIYDMETSMKTGASHLMLSGETTYGAQAGKCIELESSYQRSIYQQLLDGRSSYRTLSTLGLGELLYIL